MKKIFLAVLLFTSITTFGQNYLFFNPSSKKLFGTVPIATSTYSLSFDSVVTAGTDTVYYNFFTIPDTMANAPSNCPFWGSGCLFYQSYPSWIGKQIEHSGSGQYRFYNLVNDTLTFDMNINIGDTSLFYSSVSERFSIIYDLDDTISVLGNIDSARFYRILHTDISGNEIISPLNQQRIIVARQWGLVNFFRIDSFPQIEQPLTLLGNISPDGGLNIITSQMVYDYQPGDEVQYHDWHFNDHIPWSNYDYYKKYTFLSRTDFPDTIAYVVHQIIFDADSLFTLSDTIIPLLFYRHDTIAEIPFEFFDGKTKSLVTIDTCGQNFWRYAIYDPNNLTFCIQENCWGYFDTGGPPNYIDINYFLSLGYSSHSLQMLMSPPGFNSYGNEINFFKKNGTPCGTEQVVGIKENESRDLNIQLSPNPVNAYLNVKSEYHLKKIIFYDITGKEITSTNLSGTNEKVDVRKLQDGVYFVRIFFFDNKTAFKKIVVIKE